MHRVGSVYKRLWKDVRSTKRKIITHLSWFCFGEFHLSHVTSQLQTHDVFRNFDSETLLATQFMVTFMISAPNFIPQDISKNIKFYDYAFLYPLFSNTANGKKKLITALKRDVTTQSLRHWLRKATSFSLRSVVIFYYVVRVKHTAVLNSMTAFIFISIIRHAKCI